MTTKQIIKKTEIVNQKNWEKVQETLQILNDKIEKEVSDEYADSVGFIDSVWEQVFLKVEKKVAKQTQNIVTQITIKIKKGVEND